MDDLKHIHENIIITSFRDHYPDFPKGKLVRSESPDFILKTNPKHAIGIELTALPQHAYEITEKNLYLFLSDIEFTICKKEEKLQSYRKKMAEAYWLVIYADSIGLNGMDLDDPLESLPVSKFDRVFLFDFFDGKVWAKFL